MPVFSKPTLQAEPTQHNGSFFSNPNHLVITGGNFTSVNNSIAQPAQKSGFQILQEHVSSGAFHNAKQRVDPPRCHPHTRKAILEELFDWIVGNVPRKAWIAWLNGAAGAGKSAICQSMAEICIKRGVKVASFFFFRTDGSRNSIDPVIATLAYQITQLFPETKELIIHSIESHPLIFEQTVETQLEVLLVSPIRDLKISETLLLIIDGVDECTSDKIQADLIRTFAKVFQKKDLPLIVLFGSRRENQIQMAFNARDMDNILKHISLDNNYHVEEDLRRFLVDRFDDIKQTHPLRKHLKPTWPATEHVQEIVIKASGQFVYASVAIKFVSVPSLNPSRQLDILCGLRPAGRPMPFAELDVLYRHIFLQVKDIAVVLGILTYRILRSHIRVSEIAYFFALAEEEIESMLAPLTSVLSCDMDSDDKAQILFHHASLVDFLWDRERSHEYCISEMGTELSILWLKNAASDRFKGVSKRSMLDFPKLLSHAKPTANLRESILKYAPLQTPGAYSDSMSWPSGVLDEVQKLNFGDNGEVSRTLTGLIIGFVKERLSPNHLDRLWWYFPTLTEEQDHWEGQINLGVDVRSNGRQEGPAATDSRF